jgi:hypothetical protein
MGHPTPDLPTAGLSAFRPAWASQVWISMNSNQSDGHANGINKPHSAIAQDTIDKHHGLPRRSAEVSWGAQQ